MPVRYVEPRLCSARTTGPRTGPKPSAAAAVERLREAVRDADG